MSAGGHRPASRGLHLLGQEGLPDGAEQSRVRQGQTGRTGTGVWGHGRAAAGTAGQLKGRTPRSFPLSNDASFSQSSVLAKEGNVLVPRSRCYDCCQLTTLCRLCLLGNKGVRAKTRSGLWRSWDVLRRKTASINKDGWKDEIKPDLTPLHLHTCHQLGLNTIKYETLQIKNSFVARSLTTYWCL